MAGASSESPSPSSRGGVCRQEIKIPDTPWFAAAWTPYSESPVSSARGVREPGVPEIVPLQMLGFGAGLLPAGCSECCPPEAILGSRQETDLEGGVVSGSCIWQSARNVGVAGCAWDLPLTGVASQSGVWRLRGVWALSGVRDRSEVLGTGDCPRPVLTDPVLFRLACEKRVLSGALLELPGCEPPACWLGSTVVGGFCTIATSPTSS